MKKLPEQIDFSTFGSSLAFDTHRIAVDTAFAVNQLIDVVAELQALFESKKNLKIVDDYAHSILNAVWCCHITFISSSYPPKWVFQMPDSKSIHVMAAWKFCPICKAERPK